MQKLALLAFFIPLFGYAASDQPVSISVVQSSPAYAEIKITSHAMDTLQIQYAFSGNHPNVSLTNANDLNAPTSCGDLTLGNTCTIGLHSVVDSSVGVVDEGQIAVQVLDHGNVIKSMAFKLGTETDLYAGGAFTYAYNSDGTPVNVNGIAKWNGTAWSALDSYGLDGKVNAFTVGKDGTLYVGGVFGHAGNNPANNIANWNPVTQTWSALGIGVLGTSSPGVSALTEGSDGAIYAGGNFAYAGGVPANNIARWDGISWSAVGNVITSGVRGLTTGTDGTIYAATFLDGFLSWNPTIQQWTSLGTIFGVANAVAVNGDGSIDVGGDFGVTEPSVYNIGEWNPKTQQWAIVGGGIGSSSSDVSAVTAGTDGDIYVGGNNFFASGNPANYIAKWNGTSWSALGTGLNDQVLALTADGSGHIYAGGEFTSTGEMAASYIAMWDTGIAEWSTFAKGFNSNVLALILAPSLHISMQD